MSQALLLRWGLAGAGGGLALVVDIVNARQCHHDIIIIVPDLELATPLALAE